MTACVGEHSILNSTLAVEPSEHQTKSTVKQKASCDYHRCNANRHSRSGQMRKGKGKGGDNICPYKLRLCDLFPSGDELQKKSYTRHKEETKHKLLNHTAVGNRSEKIIESRLYKIAFTNGGNVISKEE